MALLIAVPLAGIGGLAWGGPLVAAGLGVMVVAFGYFAWAWDGADRSADL